MRKGQHITFFFSPLSFLLIRSPLCLTPPQNSELFTLTYGALVRQVMHDCDDCVEAVNEKLDKMGVSIGNRLIEDFLAKTNTTQKCVNFRETCEVVAHVGLKMFLGLTCVVSGWNEEFTECEINFEHLNPFCEFVQLPERFINEKLKYSQLLCGVIRGALQSIGMRVTCEFQQDQLLGDANFTMRLKFVENVEDEYPFED
tara:strand:+ start:5965 stop:6564 length:600 start_codon:yes stop_codon:yes gene_type:complete